MAKQYRHQQSNINENMAAKISANNGEMAKSAIAENSNQYQWRIISNVKWRRIIEETKIIISRKAKEISSMAKQ
jgi:hypothetical protein